MTTTYSKFKKQVLRDKAVRHAYDELGLEYELIRAIITQRLKRGWSQQRLAEEIGSRQLVISRLERGGSNPSLKFFQRIADAPGVSLHVSLR